MEENAFVSLVFDTAGRIIFANRYFCQLSGFSSDEIKGKVLFQPRMKHHPRQYSRR
jgi:PAS domain S-box-containing protein